MKIGAIYLIRHGQSEANANKIKQNLDDYKLSESGELSCALIKLDNNIDIIFSSPMRRCLQTAQIIQKKYQADIIKVATLIEWQVFPEKKNYLLNEENTKAINPYYLRYGLHDKYGKGESFFDVQERLIKFVKNNIIPNQSKNIAIVSHAAAINHLIDIILFGEKKNPENHYDFFLKLGHIKNCGVTKLAWNDNKYTLEYFNRINDLDDK